MSELELWLSGDSQLCSTDVLKLQVKLRVEIGPADVQQGTCVLATAAAVPGELASKVKYKVSPAQLVILCGAGKCA